MGKRMSHNVNWKVEGNLLKAVYDNYIDSHKHTHKLKHVKRQDENMPNTMSHFCFGGDFSFLNFPYNIIVISMDLEDQIILGQVLISLFTVSP